MQSLSNGKESENLKLKLDEMIDKIQDIQTKINFVMNPDVSNYKEWDITQAIFWISTLENGRYKPYCTVLKKGFESDEISPLLLPQVTRNALRCDPFNIIKFADRRDLVYHFQSLSEQKKIIAYNVEGTDTEYH